MREAEFFSHDYDARDDEKFVRLRQKMGWEGYGLAWALIEKLYQAGGRLQRDYAALAFTLAPATPDKIQAMIEGHPDLWDASTKKEIGSKSVDRRLELRAARSEMSRIAGLASAAKRSTDVERTLNGRSTTVQPIKDSKEKDSKEKKQISANGRAPTDPFHVFMNGIMKDYWKLEPEKDDAVSREQVVAAYKRHGRAGSDVLKMAGGDPTKARRGVDAVGRRMGRDGLSWNLDTVAQHFLDWNVNPEAYERGTATARK